MSPQKSFSPGRASLGAIAAFALAAILALVLVVSFLSSKSDPVAQPMRFSHKAHFEDATCAACHLYAEELAAAGRPTLEDCVDCHDGIQSEKPDDIREEEKLEVYMEEEKEIPWVQLPPLTADIYFSHRRHVAVAKEKIECEVCHGDMAETVTLPSARPVAFTMNWCMDCHEKEHASNDCIGCHR